MSETVSTARWYKSRGFVRATEPVAANTEALLRPSLRLTVAFAICVAAIANLVFFYSRGLTNVYGDGLAHLEGARRLWDSRTPGFEEIGSVWLPLFHVLASPLTRSDFLWRSGLAGSLVSTAAFVIAAWFIFRLGAEINRNVQAGVAGLCLFVLCPSMLYLATAPLTEPLAIMWLVLLVYGLFRYQQAGKVRVLLLAAMAAFFGTLTRYDGWNVLPFAALVVLLASVGSWRLRFRRAMLFLAVSGLGPLLWISYNFYHRGNILDFYNGPYSAQAIYAHQLATSGFRYPTEGSVLLSARYYLEDLRLIIGIWPLVFAVLGIVVWTVDARTRGRRSVALLFLVSLPFYLEAMAHAAVPLYVPTLFPHTFYNLRYGIEILPAVAILCSFVLSPGLAPSTRGVLLLALLVVIGGQTVSSMRDGAEQIPVVKEGLVNTPCQSQPERALTEFMRTHYDGQTILTAPGRWPCMMPELGIPYRHTITENNRAYWRELPEGPEKWVHWIIRSDADSVDELMRAHPMAFSNYNLLERRSFPTGGGFSIYRLAQGADTAEAGRQR
jgi:hypothetical protein